MVNFGATVAYAKKQRKQQNHTKNKKDDQSRNAAAKSLDDWKDHEKEDTRQTTKLGRFLDFIEPFIIFLIASNAVMMGIGTFDFVTDDEEVFAIFEKIDEAFLIIFTVEVTLASVRYLRMDMIKSIHFNKIEFHPISREERKERRMNLPWILFDATVVILSWSFNHLSIIRSFRILRALRLVGKIESMRAVVRGLFAVGPRMGMVAFMLTILFTVFGVASTMLYGDLEYDDDIDYFGTFDKSALTLFQIMTFDSWKAVARQTMEKVPYSWILFVLWVLISGFVIMNLIIAIICESLVNMKYNGDGEDSIDGSQTQQSQSQTKTFGTSTTSDAQMKMDYDEVHIRQLMDEILKDQMELLNAAEDLKKIVDRISRDC